MSNDDFALGDDSVIASDVPISSLPRLTPEEIKKQEAEVNNAASEIEKAGKITEADKKKIAAKIAKVPKNEVDEINQLTMDLNEFISDKVDIDNKDGGNFEKLPTGIDILDAIAGGGFGVGTFAMLVGSPGTFKSALLCQLIANCQRKFNGKFTATYHDSENAMTKQRLANMGVIKPAIEPFTKVTIENIFKTIMAIIAFKDSRKLTHIPTVVAWDSIANTETEKGMTTDDINSTIGLKARLLSSLLPKYVQRMKENKVTLIAVNQLREKLDMGQFAAPADLQHMGNKDIPGGQAIKFNAFHILFLKNCGDVKFEQYGFNGIKLKVAFIKNKFFRSHVSVTLLVDFDTGISNFWTNYAFLVDYKRIDAAAWNTMVSMPEKKFRTKDALELYNTDAKFKAEFDKEVKETIQREIISKVKDVVIPEE